MLWLRVDQDMGFLAVTIEAHFAKQSFTILKFPFAVKTAVKTRENSKVKQNLVQFNSESRFWAHHRVCEQELS